MVVKVPVQTVGMKADLGEHGSDRTNAEGAAPEYDAQLPFARRQDLPPGPL
ncbi:MAG: hypothetical protein P8019_14040 [Gammaproteobacteria bacterium]